MAESGSAGIEQTQRMRVCIGNRLQTVGKIFVADVMSVTEKSERTTEPIRTLTETFITVFHALDGSVSDVRQRAVEIKNEKIRQVLASWNTVVFKRHFMVSRHAYHRTPGKIEKVKIAHAVAEMDDVGTGVSGEDFFHESRSSVRIRKNDDLVLSSD